MTKSHQWSSRIKCTNGDRTRRDQCWGLWPFPIPEIEAENI